MTPDDLDRIEERLAKANPSSDLYTANEWYAARAQLTMNDVPALLAEVRRLSADLLVQQRATDEARAELEEWKRDYGRSAAERAVLTARAEQAEAALARVRVELDEANESNQTWQEVAARVCDAAGVEPLVRVPQAIVDVRLRAEKAEAEARDLRERVSVIHAENIRLREREYRVRAGVLARWDSQCDGWKAPDRCESCRAYESVIQVIDRHIRPAIDQEEKK